MYSFYFKLIFVDLISNRVSTKNIYIFLFFVWHYKEKIDYFSFMSLRCMLTLLCCFYVIMSGCSHCKHNDITFFLCHNLCLYDCISSVNYIGFRGGYF